MAEIVDDHVLPSLDVGQERGVPYLVMPLLRGETLRKRLTREGALPVTEILRIGREMAAGLAAAWRRLTSEACCAATSSRETCGSKPKAITSSCSTLAWLGPCGTSPVVDPLSWLGRRRTWHPSMGVVSRSIIAPTFSVLVASCTRCVPARLHSRAKPRLGF